MNDEDNVKKLVLYWLEKSNESIAAARDEMNAGRLSFSVNRIYYACFYAVCALLLRENLRFKKHSGVRAAFHQNFVKSGDVDTELGKFYDELFEARQRGDYIELVEFDLEQVNGWLDQAAVFIGAIRKLIK